MALLLIVKLPWRLPKRSGVKVMLMLQLCIGLSNAGGLGQLLVWSYSLLLLLMLPMRSGKPPALLSVSAWLLLAPPIIAVPKPRLVELNLTTGAGMAMAVPLRLMTPALALAALLAILSVAALLPIAPDGLKLRLTTQLAFGISVPQPPLTWKSLLVVLALVGLILNVPTVRSMVPVLVTLTGCGALLMPST